MGREAKVGRTAEGGFTLIELMIALAVTVIGLMGLVSLLGASVRASAHSRHATVASVLAEDRLEEMRVGALTTGTRDEKVNERGLPDDEGLYTRRSDVTSATFNSGEGQTLGTLLNVTIQVSWREGAEDEARSVTMFTQRLP